MTNTTSPAGENLAQRIIAKIFTDYFKPGLHEMAFRRDELVAAAEALGEPRPKNQRHRRHIQQFPGRNRRSVCGTR